MTDKKNTEATAAPEMLIDESLDKVRGGAAYLKFDGIDGESKYSYDPVSFDFVEAPKRGYGGQLEGTVVPGVGSADDPHAGKPAHLIKVISPN